MVEWEYEVRRNQYSTAPLTSIAQQLTRPFTMSSSSRNLLAVVCGWSSLIHIAFSTDSDPSVFFPDDFVLAATEYSNTEGGLFSDLFSGSDPIFDQGGLDFSLAPDVPSATLDPQWLSYADSDPGGLEASCAGGSGPQSFGKVRREDWQRCFQNPQKTNPDFSNLKLPDFMQIEQTLENIQVEPDAKAGSVSGDDNTNCPEPYGRHVCCTGPGIRSFLDAGIYDFVQGCEPCMYLMIIPCLRLSLSCPLPLYSSTYVWKSVQLIYDYYYDFKGSQLA